MADEIDWSKASLADMRLLRMAAVRGWRVPDAIRSEALLGLAKILTGSASDRDRVAAAKTLAAFDSIDQRDDHLALQRLKFERESPKETAVSVADAVRAMEDAAIDYLDEKGDDVVPTPDIDDSRAANPGGRPCLPGEGADQAF